MRFNSALFGKDPVYAEQWRGALAILFRAREDLEVAIAISSERLWTVNGNPLVTPRPTVIVAVTARLGPGLAFHGGTERKSGRIRWDDDVETVSGRQAVERGRRHGLIVLPEWRLSRP